MSLNFSFAFTWHQVKLSCKQKISMTIHVLPTSPKQIKNTPPTSGHSWQCCQAAPSFSGWELEIKFGPCHVLRILMLDLRGSRDKDGCTPSVRVPMVFSWCSLGILGDFFIQKYSRDTGRFFKGFPIGGPCWDRGTSLPIPWGSMKMWESYTQVRSDIGFVWTTTSNTGSSSHFQATSFTWMFWLFPTISQSKDLVHPTDSPTIYFQMVGTPSASR